MRDVFRDMSRGQDCIMIIADALTEHYGFTDAVTELVLRCGVRMASKCNKDSENVYAPLVMVSTHLCFH